MVYGGLILLTAPIIPMLQVYEVIIKYTLTITVVNILAGLCAILSKSWSYLFTTYGYGDNESGSNSIKSYPLSYISSGEYFWTKGRLFYQAAYGDYWSVSVFDRYDGYTLNIRKLSLAKSGRFNKVYGSSMRCANLIIQRRGSPWYL